MLISFKSKNILFAGVKFRHFAFLQEIDKIGRPKITILTPLPSQPPQRGLAAKPHFFLWLSRGLVGGLGWTSQKKVYPDWSGRSPTLTAAMSAKKAASHWVEVAGGVGVDKTTHSPPFFPRPQLEEEEEGEG